MTRMTHKLTSCHKGFTLLEVMISLAMVGGLLLTLIYTLNFHLAIAERQEVLTVAVNLAKGKLYELRRNPALAKGNFPEPHGRCFYETSAGESVFPGMLKINVVVKCGKEEIILSELIRKGK